MEYVSKPSWIAEVFALDDGGIRKLPLFYCRGIQLPILDSVEFAYDLILIAVVFISDPSLSAVVYTPLLLLRASGLFLHEVRGEIQ